MSKALISIDYTYDFVADDGKLTAGKPAQAISKAIAQVTQKAYDNGDSPLMVMMKVMIFILKRSCFHHIISRVQADVICMGR